MRRRTRKTKVILSSLFAFLLTLLLLVLFSSIGLGIGVFNSRNISKAINKSDYIGKAYVAINQRTEEVLLEAGLPRDLLSDIITPARVHADGMNYASQALSTKQEPDNSLEDQRKLHGQIQTAILEYAIEQGISQSSELSEGISEGIPESIKVIADRIEDEYISRVEIKFIEYLKNYKLDYKRLMVVIIPSIMLIIAILCYMIIRMHRYKYRGLRYIAYGLIASSVLMIALAWYTLYNKGYHMIKLAPSYYQYFISSYLRMSITVFAYIGILGILLAVVLTTLIGVMRNKIINT